MLVAGKEGDTSEEEEIELVVDEDQKDMGDSCNQKRDKMAAG